MQQQTINPDIICANAVQSKLAVYQAKEHFESVLKGYNDQIDNMINLVNLMKNRILELEGEREKARSQPPSPHGYGGPGRSEVSGQPAQMETVEDS